MQSKGNTRNRPNWLSIEECERRHLLAASSVVAAGETPTDVVAEFSLFDVNATSDTFNQKVAPADYRGQVSAWYYGFAT